MPNLMKLCLQNSGIRNFPTSLLVNLTGIDRLELFGCKNLELIQHTICYTRIQLLLISECSKLKSLPLPLSSVLNLVQRLCLKGTLVSKIPDSLFSCFTPMLCLELSRTNIMRIPENIKFSKLRKLDIRGCRFLQSLPELPLTMEEVHASGCTSLKMVSNLLTALTQPPTDRVNLGVAFSFMDCLKLEHQNLMSEFQMRASLIATEFALKKTPDKSCPPTTKMCYPGDNIPEWFIYQNKGRKKYNRWAAAKIHLDSEIYVKTIDGDERHLPLPLQLLNSNAKNHVSMTTFMCNVEFFYSALDMSFNFGTEGEADVKIKRAHERNFVILVGAALNHSGDTSCPLCGSGLETAIHLFLFCERVRPLWFISRWGLRTDSLLCDSMASFLEIVFDPNYDRDFLIYVSLLVDNIWRARNKLVYDGKVFHVAEIHSYVQAQFNQISTSKRKRKWRSLT
ncbi:hypothetical protein TIFTF001_030911 [Ficus carica]|uniref:Uncharacterized protein n=1 Tax=Ficus carica TaxID=3494 RepID=A0AA88DUF5_FICCA|nr:hypothetical protein TIFTF001_030911 [Ficus carica]